MYGIPKHGDVAIETLGGYAMITTVCITITYLWLYMNVKIKDMHSKTFLILTFKKDNMFVCILIIAQSTRHFLYLLL